MSLHLLPILFLLVFSTRDPDSPVVCKDEKTVLRGNAPPHGFEQWCELPGAIKHGQYKTWHANGKVAKDYWFQNGELNGPGVEFLPNRIPVITGFYRSGKRHGTFQFVNPKDTSDSTTIPFVNDVPNGTGRRSISEGGNAEVRFQNGKMVGVLNFEDLRGRVYKKCKTVDGSMGPCTYHFPAGGPSQQTEAEEFDGEFAVHALTLCYGKQPPYLTGTAAKALISPLVRIRITALYKQLTYAKVEATISSRPPSPDTFLWRAEKRKTFSFSRTRSGSWKPVTCPWF